MTIAVSDSAPRPTHGFDFTKLVLYGFALALCLLIVLPMSWLVYYAFTDKNGAFSLQNFVTLVNDPTLLDPLITTFILAFSTSLICCAVAAPMGWLVARTDMPLRRTVRVLVTASFVTPPFLGAIAWELLAAPNSGPAQQALPLGHRRRFRRRPVQHLFVPRADLRHRLLHLPLCVRAGRQRARPHAGRA